MGSSGRVALAALALACLGNGGNSHAWITEHALEHLPDGALQRMLTSPEVRPMLINGSVFPDGGYVVDDDYGEMAHWEPFVEAYIRWIRDELPRPLDRGAAAEHVAFLMGVASHGMADQVFDATYMDAARIHDAAGWSDELLMDFDSATDVVLVAETGVNYLDLPVWVPAEEVSALYRDAFGYAIGPDELFNTQELLHRIVLNYAVSTAADPADVQEQRDRYPWGTANLMDPTFVGSPPCEGEIVADYFLAIWDRLHDESGLQNYVIATYPRDGAAGHPTDSTLVESEVVIVFGSGVAEADLAGRVTVTDAAGAPVDVTIGTQWGADVANLVKLRPLDDWAADATYTVTVAPGLVTNDGLSLDAPWSFTFSTAAAPVTDPTSDPTPHTGEPDVGAPAEAGGCCAASGGAGSALLAVLVLSALRAGPSRGTRRPRRRAGRRS